MKIRESTEQDQELIFAMYKRVAAIPGGLARLDSEVVPEYVAEFSRRALSSGLSLVACVGDQIAGEIHAYPSGLFCFSHVWSDLTIAIDPSHQGQNVGRELFEKFMQRVTERSHLQRVELVARESNQKAISFYESLGFRKEGRFENRIKNVNGTYEADIPMAWVRTSVTGT